MDARTGTLGLAGLLALALTGCGSDATAADTIVAGRVSTEVAGEATRIVVPTGTLSVTVGDPLDGTVPADQAEDGDDHGAPDGRRWVPVSWSFDPLAPFPGQAVVSQQPRATEVALEGADGTTTDLPAPYTLDGTSIGDSATTVFYVATEDPDHLTLGVTYDGLTQRLDVATGEVDEDAAAPLYESPTSAQELDCGDGERVGTDTAAVTLRCEMAVERVPYLPGTGWAAEGRSFVVLGWSFSTDSAGDEGTTATVTVDGRPALARVSGSSGEADPGDVAESLQAFDAPADGGEALVDVTVQTGGDGPVEHEVSVALP